jgi:hypothetical protein
MAKPDVFNQKTLQDETTPRYKSKDGFVEVPVYRGFGEIYKLWNDVILHNKCIVLGGYVRYMCSPNLEPVPAGDLDLYCPEQETYEKVLKIFSDYDMTIKHENDVSISYSKLTIEDHLFPCPDIQLIKPMAQGVIVTQGNLQEIISNFDFTVIRIGLLSPTTALADADFIHDETEKLLRIKNIHCPVSSFYRVMKYRIKGYWPPSSLIVAILQDWNNRDDDYKKEIMEFFEKAEKDKLDKEEIDRMERLLRLTD